MSDPVIIQIVSFAFLPKIAEIQLGQSVVWRNMDTVHHTASRTTAPVFDTGMIAPGEQSSPIAFNEVTSLSGVEYQCRPHPFMKGTIIVK